MPVDVSGISKVPCRRLGNKEIRRHFVFYDFVCLSSFFVFFFYLFYNTLYSFSILNKASKSRFVIFCFFKCSGKDAKQNRRKFDNMKQTFKSVKLSFYF